MWFLEVQHLSSIRDVYVHWTFYNFAWNIIGLDIRYKLYSRLVSGGSKHCYFRWKMLFHGISRKKSFRTATPTELHPDFRIEAIPPLYIVCIYKTILRKVPLPCFLDFQEIIERDANNWLDCTTQQPIYKLKSVGLFSAWSHVGTLYMCANIFHAKLFINL